MRVLIGPIKLGHCECDAGGGAGCSLLSPCVSYGGYVYGGSCIWFYSWVKYKAAYNVILKAVFHY